MKTTYFGNLYIKNYDLTLPNVKLDFKKPVIIIHYDFDPLNQYDFSDQYIDLTLETDKEYIKMNNCYLIKHTYIFFSKNTTKKSTINIKTISDIIIESKISNDKITKIETNILNFFHEDEEKKLKHINNDTYQINFENKEPSNDTLCLTIESKNNLELDFSVDKFKQLNDLLSLISCNKTTWDILYYKNNNNEIIKKIINYQKIDKSDNYNDITIKNLDFHSRNLEDIVSKIEKYYKNLEEKNLNYPIHLISSYYLEAYNQKYLEMIIMSMMTCVEIILDNFISYQSKNTEKNLSKEINESRNESALEVIRNCLDLFLKENANKKCNEISVKDFKIGKKKLKKIRKGGTLPEMKEKLNSFQKYYEISFKIELDTIIFIRNKITHTGKLPITTHEGKKIDIIKEKENLQKFLNQIFEVIFI